jgi:hypothetical protein
MKQIEEEEPSIYKKFVMDYTVGLGKIYSESEIALAMRSPSFPREYQCQYGGFASNIFSSDSIHRAVEIEGRKYDSTKDYVSYSRHVIAVDPAYSTSKFGICVIQLYNGKVQVLYAEDFDHPDFNKMLHFVVALMQRYSHVNAVMVDGANVPFVASLKRMLGERPDYQEHIKQLKHNYSNIPIIKFMKVLPINFSTEHKTLLSHSKAMLDDDRNLVQIHPSFTKLIDSLKSATADEYSLDKQQTVNSDIFDSFRMALSYVVLQPQGAVR